MTQDGLDPEVMQIKSVVATNETANVSFELHDPNGYLKDYNKTYTWKVNGTSIGDPSSQMIQYNFSEPVNYILSVIVEAIGPNHRTVEMTKNVEAKNPLKSVHDHGLYFLYRKLDLTVTCDGSGPFHFCHNYFENESLSKAENSCEHYPTLTSDECAFNVSRYFYGPGTFYLRYQVYNDVSWDSRTVKVDVIKCKLLLILIQQFIHLPFNHRSKATSALIRCHSCGLLSNGDCHSHVWCNVSRPAATKVRD